MALKVYRTPIGFHDAYVAAPSQKAALAAWGADKDLFARGAAEEVVTDEALTGEPLARPGKVIKRPRGSVDEQLAAAPATKRKALRPSVSKAAEPRPDRARVDTAAAALITAEERHREAEQALSAEEKALAERRRTIRAKWIAERDRLEAVRTDAEEEYAAALKRWRAG